MSKFSDDSFGTAPDARSADETLVLLDNLIYLGPLFNLLNKDIVTNKICNVDGLRCIPVSSNKSVAQLAADIRKGMEEGLYYNTGVKVQENQETSLQSDIKTTNITNHPPCLMTNEQWIDVLAVIENDDYMKSLRVLAYYNKWDGDLGRGILFEDSDGDCIICYQGTGNAEWLTNAQGLASPSLSQIQEDAIAFTQFCAEKFDLINKDVAATGHSTGGNKAYTAAVLCPEIIDYCLSFEGQGFSTWFYDTYKTEIENIETKVNRIAEIGDFVHGLTANLQKTTYYSRRTNRPVRSEHGDPFLWSHCPDAIIDKAGRFTDPVETDHPPLTRVVSAVSKRLLEHEKSQAFAAALMYYLQIDKYKYLAAIFTMEDGIEKAKLLKKHLTDPAPADITPDELISMGIKAAQEIASYSRSAAAILGEMFKQDHIFNEDFVMMLEDEELRWSIIVHLLDLEDNEGNAFFKESFGVVLNKALSDTEINRGLLQVLACLLPLLGKESIYLTDTEALEDLLSAVKAIRNLALFSPKFMNVLVRVVNQPGMIKISGKKKIMLDAVVFIAVFIISVAYSQNVFDNLSSIIDKLFQTTPFRSIMNALRSLKENVARFIRAILDKFIIQRLPSESGQSSDQRPETTEDGVVPFVQNYVTPMEFKQSPDQRPETTEDGKAPLEQEYVLPSESGLSSEIHLETTEDGVVPFDHDYVTPMESAQGLDQRLETTPDDEVPVDEEYVLNASLEVLDAAYELETEKGKGIRKLDRITCELEKLVTSHEKYKKHGKHAHKNEKRTFRYG